MITRALLAMSVVLLPAIARAQPDVTARGAIIVDAETGSVVWERNADQLLPPASTTKVMTAVLALQSHRLDHPFRVSANASATPPSKIGLRPGQEVSLRDLLFAVLLKSANDAAVVVAEGVSGSEYEFARQMNLKSRIIGATSTNFENPHGLTEGGHLTTARDLSRIFRYGLGVPGFREVLYTPSAPVFIDGPASRLTTVRSHNRLLYAPDFQVIGKTGYTRAARRCFVGAAGSGAREVVIAILGSTDLWGDARRMLDFGMSRNRPAPVIMASATPPPPPAQAVMRAEPERAVEPAPAPVEMRAAPARPGPPGYRAAPPPVEAASVTASSAPQAALDRAARMARARPELEVPTYEEAEAARTGSARIVVPPPGPGEGIDRQPPPSRAVANVDRAGDPDTSNIRAESPVDEAEAAPVPSAILEEEPEPEPEDEPAAAPRPARRAAPPPRKPAAEPVRAKTAAARPAKSSAPEAERGAGSAAATRSGKRTVAPEREPSRTATRTATSSRATKAERPAASSRDPRAARAAAEPRATAQNAKATASTRTTVARRGADPRGAGQKPESGKAADRKKTEKKTEKKVEKVASQSRASAQRAR